MYIVNVCILNKCISQAFRLIKMYDYKKDHENMQQVYVCYIYKELDKTISLITCIQFIIKYRDFVRVSELN